MRKKSASRMHISRARGGIDASQCADGVEAVEQEMRIDLRLERFQFRVSRQNAGLQHASLRGAGFLDFEDHIIGSNSQRIEQEPAANSSGACGANF